MADIDTKNSDISSLSDKELLALIDSHRTEKSALPEKTAEPESKPLEGKVEYSEGMLDKATDLSKQYFPQSDDNYPLSGALNALKYPMLMARGASDGAGAVGEDLTNAALGSAQQMLPPSVPRMTAGDLMRLVPGMQNGITTNELTNSPPFQQAMQQNPAAAAAYNVPKFVGGLAAPIGQLTGHVLGGAAAPALNFIKGAVPAVQRAAGPLINIAQNSKPAQLMSQLGMQHPLVQGLRGAGTGAAISPVFNAGATFGSQRRMPTGQETGDAALTGGLVGGGLGVAGATIARQLLEARIKQYAKESGLADGTPPKPIFTPTEVLDDPATMRAKLTTQVFQAMLDHAHDPKVQDELIEKALNDARQKYGSDSDEAKLAIESVAKEVAQQRLNLARRQDATVDRRQYSEAQKQQARRYSEAQKQQNIARASGQTTGSQSEFQRLSHELRSAPTRDRLNALRSDIASTAPGPTGKPLLSSAERTELQRQWRVHMRRLRRGGGRQPGESNNPPGTPSGSPSGRQTPETPQTSPPQNPQLEGRAEQNVPLDEQTSPSREQSAPESERDEASGEQPVSDFLKGAFRRNIDKGTYGPRKTLYKSAVSTRALGEAAGFSPEKIDALEKWVGSLSETRLEITAFEERIAELSEWAAKNEDKWAAAESNIEVSHKNLDGADHIVLDHLEREGRYRTMALRTKYTKTVQDTLDENLEPHITNDNGTPRLTEVRRAHVRTTSNGKTTPDAWAENHDGSLHIDGDELGDLPRPQFKEPKNSTELFERMERLKQGLSDYQTELTQIKNAKGEHGHLPRIDGGEIPTPASLMGEAFDALKIPYLEGRQELNVWHVDDEGHVSTTTFVQPSTQTTLEGAHSDLQARMQKFYEGVPKKADGEPDYDAFWAMGKKRKELLARCFTGIELPFVGALMATRKLAPVLSKIGRQTGTDAIFAGTIDNVLSDVGHKHFGVNELSEQLHGMLGRINERFFFDDSGQYHPVRNADDMSEMLNSFRGVKLQRSAYRRAAQDALIEEHGAENITQEMLDAANKKADTAMMVRQEYKGLATKVQEKIDQMEIRKKDAATGVPSKEGQKFYEEEDIDREGRVKRSAYNQLVHDALTELHLGLTLQPGKFGQMGGFWGSLANRTTTSIMANSVHTMAKNVFDQLPFSVAHFGQNFVAAAADYHGSPLKGHIERLPIVTQSDAAVSAAQAQLDNVMKQAKPSNFAEAAGDLYTRVNHFLGTRLDPFFKGRSPIVGLPDQHYARISTLASLYKQAPDYGMTRDDFVNGLVNNEFSPAEQAKIFQQVGKDLTTTLNVVSPSLNKDLFASSTLGRMNNQFATPGRRNMKQLEGYLRSPWTTKAGATDKLRFASAFTGLVALGGRGAVPASVLAGYGLYNAITGQNEEGEKNLQWLDHLNVLRATTGIDYSNNFGPDFYTNSAPAIEALQKTAGRAKAEATKSNTLSEGTLKAALAITEGLSLFPKMGPLGYTQAKSLVKNELASQDGKKKIYFQDGGSLRSVEIDYNNYDMVHDFLFGGVNPKAYDAINESRLEHARKNDDAFRQSRDIMPEKSNSRRNVVPNS